MGSLDWWSLEKEVIVPSLVPYGHAPFQSATHKEAPTPEQTPAQESVSTGF